MGFRARCWSGAVWALWVVPSSLLHVSSLPRMRLFLPTAPPVQGVPHQPAHEPVLQREKGQEKCRARGQARGGPRKAEGEEEARQEGARNQTAARGRARSGEGAPCACGEMPALSVMGLESRSPPLRNAPCCWNGSVLPYGLPALSSLCGVCCAIRHHGSRNSPHNSVLDFVANCFAMVLLSKGDPCSSPLGSRLLKRAPSPTAVEFTALVTPRALHRNRVQCRCLGCARA